MLAPQYASSIQSFLPGYDQPLQPLVLRHSTTPSTDMLPVPSTLTADVDNRVSRLLTRRPATSIVELLRGHRFAGRRGGTKPRTVLTDSSGFCLTPPLARVLHPLAGRSPIKAYLQSDARAGRSPPVILSVAKDQPPVFGSSYCRTAVPLTIIILYVEVSDLLT
jgi:hypothetical protein